jgi:hypothetical protein
VDPNYGIYVITLEWTFGKIDMQFVLLMVEGQHDVAFLGQLLTQGGYTRQRKKRDVDSFWTNAIPNKYPIADDLDARMPTPVFYASDSVSVAIKSVDGIERIAIETKQTLDVVGLPQSVGFFLDADSQSGEQRHAELQQRLQSQTDILLPNVPGNVKDGNPRCGSYIFPDNVMSGTLEHILVECGNIHYNGLLTQSTSFISDVDITQLTEEELRGLNKPQGRTKAALCCVASVLKPAQTIQASIRSDRWLTEEAMSLPLVSAVQKFLGHLLSPLDTGFAPGEMVPD